MRKLIPLTIAAAGLYVAGLGCNSSPNGNGGHGCDSDEVYSDRTNQCVPETTGDTGGNGGRDTGTSGDAGGSDGDPYKNGCKKRSNYVVVHRPNVFFVFDRSESMQGKPMQQATSGLDQVAEAIADRVRVGMSMFPKSGLCSSKRLLPMGNHSASEIKDAYSDLDAVGGTPAGMALHHVRGQEWYREPGDQKHDKRQKAVILITDGEPNDSEICGDNVFTAWNEAERLQRLGVPVYVIGFKTGNNLQPLNDIAEKGGTDAPGKNRFYATSDGQDLADTLTSITGKSVACGFELDPPAPEGASINVTLAGERVPQGKNNGFVYDDASASVKLNGSWCDKLQSQGKSGGTTLEIDVGCPDCAVAGESCSSDSDCCDGTCKNGTCQEACHGSGETCRVDGDCCSGTCAVPDQNKLGQCTQS